MARLVRITVGGIARVIDLMRGTTGATPTSGYGYTPYGTGPYGS